MISQTVIGVRVQFKGRKILSQTKCVDDYYYIMFFFPCFEFAEFKSFVIMTSHVMKRI